MIGSFELLPVARISESKARPLTKLLLNSIVMQDAVFEWDDEKARKNWLDHHVTFEMAREVFNDVFAVEWTDTGHGDAEERFIIVGMAEHRLLFASYTLRDERIRMISARLAEPYERRRYHNENQT